MINNPPDHWIPDFDSQSPLFEPLREVACPFARFNACWPELSDYQQVLDAQENPIVTQNGQRLKIVPQDIRPQRFEEHYSPRIHATGELQTRRYNWHDFFQFLTWVMFPQTKAQINALHIPHVETRLSSGGDRGRRSPLENMLSLFDEGGAVVLASDASLLQLIRNFQWKPLFLERRAELADKLQCITFGHALYEKALRPYIGMTANTILLEVDCAFFALPQVERLHEVDRRLASLFATGADYREPRDLQPFPILGMPGWDAANADAAYYDNDRYFRLGRGCTSYTKDVV